MRNVSGTILRSAVAGALGLTMLLAPLALGRNDIASAQTATQVTLSLDSPNPGITVTNGQRVLVGGWAGAPGQRGSGISSVDVYLDGTTDLNAWQGEARLGIARQDVATTTRHPEWSNSGFNFEWMPRNVSQGTHTLYVVARSASGESATQ